MARCRPHMVDDCPYCKEAAQVAAQYPKHVWITTSSGGAFHKGKNCAALRKGQRIVENKGGTPAPVIAVQYKQAKARGTEPCQACFPPNRKR